MSARSRMKIRSARLPAPILVLHQNLLRQEPDLHILCNTSDRARFEVGYVRRYAPSSSRFILRLTKNLLRELSLVAFPSPHRQKCRLHKPSPSRRRGTASAVDEDADQSRSYILAIESNDLISLLQVGEGGPRQRWMRMPIKAEATSSLSKVTT